MDLAGLVAERLGTPVNLCPAQGGVSRLGFVVNDGDGIPVAFLRIDDGSSGMNGTKYDLRREAGLLARLAHTQVPVPAVLAVLNEPPSILMGFVRGESALSPDTVDSVAKDFMEHLASIHRLDPRILAAGPAPPSARDAVRADLAWWTDRQVGGDYPNDPLLALASRLLSEMLPADDAPPCVLHGDAGPGNFLSEGGRVTAVLDWELAHLGEHHEDLAWMIARSVHTPFGAIPDRIRDYEIAAGVSIDPQRLFWAHCFVLFKTVVAMSSATRGPGRPGYGELGLLLVYRFQLAQGLAGAMGEPIQLLAAEPEYLATGRSRLMEQLRAQLPGDDRPATLAADYLVAAERISTWAGNEQRRDLGAVDPHGLGLATVIDRTPTDALAPVATSVAAEADRCLYPHRHAVRWARSAQDAQAHVQIWKR